MAGILGLLRGMSGRPAPSPSSLPMLNQAATTLLRACPFTSHHLLQAAYGSAGPNDNNELSYLLISFSQVRPRIEWRRKA